MAVNREVYEEVARALAITRPLHAALPHQAPLAA
jgi:hypothetical protein